MEQTHTEDEPGVRTSGIEDHRPLQGLQRCRKVPAAAKRNCLVVAGIGMIGLREGEFPKMRGGIGELAAFKGKLPCKEKRITIVECECRFQCLRSRGGVTANLAAHSLDNGRVGRGAPCQLG